MRTTAGNKTVRNINTAVLILILTLISLVVLYPLVYAVSGAFSPGNSLANLSILPFGNGFTTEHFTFLFTKTDYGRWFTNTLIIAVSTSLSTLLVASMSAYVFSRFRFTFKKTFMLSMLILQIFPSFVGMVAIYVIINRIGAFDQLWGLVLVYLAGNVPFNTWLVKSYFDNIPRSLDEAARIDGAGNWRIFFQIVMPIAKPILIFLTVTSFTGPWMDYIFPKMILRSPEKMTLALGLFTFATDRKNEFTNLAAGSLIVAIPFVIFFVITQKMLVTSLGGAAVKE